MHVESIVDFFYAGDFTGNQKYKELDKQTHTCEECILNRKKEILEAKARDNAKRKKEQIRKDYKAGKMTSEEYYKRLWGV